MKQKFISRTILNLLLLILAVATGYSQVKGSEQVVKQDREVGSFSGIKVKSGIDLAVRQGTDNALVVEADENLQEYIISEVKEGVLHIYVKKNTNIMRSTKMDAHVSVKDLESLSISGGGDVESVNRIASEDLAISISGGGDLKFEFSANSTHCSVAGGGDVILEGECKEMKTSIAGGGDLVMDVSISSLALSMSGGGDAVIDGGDNISEVKISMSGGGELVLEGVCKTVQVSVSGGGNVVCDAGNIVSEAAFSVGGGGNLTMELNAEDLKVSVGGGGDANLKGSSEKFSGEIKSGGDLRAEDFKIQTADLELTGGSDAWIQVEKNLTIKGSGGSQIYIKGDPQIDANLTGGSKIHHK